MKTPVLLTLAAALATAPGLAAADWSGPYVGGHAAATGQPGDADETVRFDTNLDGNYGDNVNTAAGANAFSPGFCGGAANGRTPAEGCRADDDDGEFGLRAGYDWQRGSLVYGVVAEYASGEATDSVSAFSTTPAFYTMTRELESTIALRGRIGFAFGDGGNLVYATAGYARASVENSFRTSNGVNTFVQRGDSNASGLQYGLGYERELTEHFSLGLEYLVSNLDDDAYRVRAQGPAPATNPFILVNPNGTDFRRSDEDFKFSSARLVLNFRF